MPYSTPLSANASAPMANSTGPRSEEHTSELQSQSNLVCRLLLEKKKQSALGPARAGHHLPPAAQDCAASEFAAPPRNSTLPSHQVPALRCGDTAALYRLSRPFSP